MDAEQGGEQAPNSQPPLTPEQAEKLLKANYRLLVQRVAKGQPLSVSDRKLLESIASGAAGASSTFARNQSELADILGVNRKTIQRGLTRPGNPGAKPDGRLDVAAWREFLRGVSGIEDAGDIDATRERARHILLKNQKLQQDIDIKGGLYVAKIDVEKAVAAMVLNVKRLLLNGPSSLAPQVVGLTIPEAEKLLSEWLHGAMAQLHQDPIGKAHQEEFESAPEPAMGGSNEQ
jgi:hypothetical protein